LQQSPRPLTGLGPAPPWGDTRPVGTPSGGKRSACCSSIVQPGKVARFNPACGAALRAVEARQLQQVRAAPVAGLKKARARRNPNPPARAPRGLSRHEARLSRCSSAIGLMQQGNFRNDETR